MTKEIIEKYMAERACLGSDKTLKILEVFEDNFRVNVWVSDPVNKITQSYFIRTNETGVIYCNPQLGA